MSFFSPLLFPLLFSLPVLSLFLSDYLCAALECGLIDEAAGLTSEDFEEVWNRREKTESALLYWNNIPRIPVIDGLSHSLLV